MRKMTKFMILLNPEIFSTTFGKPIIIRGKVVY